MALSTMRKTGADPYAPPSQVEQDQEIPPLRSTHSRTNDIPPQAPPFSPSTGLIILGALVIIGVVVAMIFGSSQTLTPPVTEPTGTSSTQTEQPQTVPTPPPAPTVQPPVTEPVTPTQQQGTGTTVQ